VIFPRPPRAIFFDLDETIIDHRDAVHAAIDALHAAFEDAYGRYDCDRFHAGFHAISNRLWGEYFAGAITSQELRGRRVTEHLLACLEDRPELHPAIDHAGMMAIYARVFVDATTAYDGVAPLLEALRPHHTLGVISNGFGSVQRDRLRATGLDRFFEHQIYSDADRIHKPDRRIFETALAAAGTEPAETIFCGDSFVHDIQGAIDAGLAAIWYNPGGLPVPDDLLHIRPTATVGSIEELARLLLPLNQSTSATPRRIALP
jgi:HAD superfamily hydrolase (TIGR01509 family)